MTQPLVPVDSRTADWPRKVAQAINWLINRVTTAGGAAIWGGITGTLSDQTDLTSALGGKQATLVSGTNIKTVNSTTLLGSGNLAVGTVTSVAASVPTGFTIGGSPITGTGTLAISFSAGYSLPTDAAQANWNTAFGWGNHASAGYLTTAAAAAAYQPLDTQLTSVAALAYTGNSLKVVRVNSGETGFELATVSGGSLADGDYGDITVGGSGTTLTVDNDAITYAKLQNVSATSRIIGRKTASAGDAEECTLSEILDFIGSAAQGDILYRGSSAWARLAAGTSGEVLKTRGTGANPAWATMGWQLVDQSGAATTGSTWTFSTNVAQVDIVGLASYDDLLVIVRGVSASVSGVRQLLASVNNGSTFYSSSGDYINVSDAGTEANQSAFAFHNTASTAARSFSATVLNLGGPLAQATGHRAIPNVNQFAASTSRINAIRINNSGGGNLTAGSIYVYVK